MKTGNAISTTILLGLACVAFSPIAQAVVPAPDGGYPGENTAEGTSALLHLNGGTYNTAVGWASLGFDVIGNLNTAVGARERFFSIRRIENTRGWCRGALLSNTTGEDNTANQHRFQQHHRCAEHRRRSTALLNSARRAFSNILPSAMAHYTVMSVAATRLSVPMRSAATR